MFLFATYVRFELFFATVKVYHVHGLFGKATDDFTENGLIREKSTYGERLRLRDAVHIVGTCRFPAFNLCLCKVCSSNILHLVMLTNWVFRTMYNQGHISEVKLKRLLATVQGGHQKYMYQ